MLFWLRGKQQIEFMFSGSIDSMEWFITHTFVRYLLWTHIKLKEQIQSLRERR